MYQNDMEELEKKLSDLIRKNEVQFKQGSTTLNVSKINQLTILSLIPQELHNKDNYSFKGSIEVFIKSESSDDYFSLQGKFEGSAKIDNINSIEINNPIFIKKQ